MFAEKFRNIYVFPKISLYVFRKISLYMFAEKFRFMFSEKIHFMCFPKNFAKCFPKNFAICFPKNFAICFPKNFAIYVFEKFRYMFSKKFNYMCFPKNLTIYVFPKISLRVFAEEFAEAMQGLPPFPAVVAKRLGGDKANLTVDEWASFVAAENPLRRCSATPSRGCLQLK